MWDGENEPLIAYVEKFKKFLEIFQEDELRVFNSYKGEMSNEDFNNFRDNHSIFSTKITVDPLNLKSENSFGLKFNDNGKLSYFEKKHEIEDI